MADAGKSHDASCAQWQDDWLRRKSKSLKNERIVLKKPEIVRDQIGRFERKGRLAKSAKAKTKIAGNRQNPIENIPVEKRQIGRPPGSLNKTTAALKDMILNSLDRMGGEEYLMQLAKDNSSAYAGLIAKVLPSTLSTPDSNGGGLVMTFRREIVYPDGHKHIEGETPLQLPAPLPSALPQVQVDDYGSKEIKDLDDKDTL